MATHLALHAPEVDGVILEATFTNIPAMVKETNFGFLPVSGLITQRFDNLERIHQLRVPVLIAHGTADSIVPYMMSEQLFAAAKSPKRLFKAEGGSHHNLTQRFYDDYSAAVYSHFGLVGQSHTAQTAGTAPAIASSLGGSVNTRN